MSKRSAAQGGTPQPGALDLGTLALFVGQACAEVVQQGLVQCGFDDVRFSHGFVFQHLVEGDRSIGELAERLGVTQQATSKSVAELERLGYVERGNDEADARRRVVRLTPRGRAVIDAARRARSKLERQLVRRHGASAITTCKAALAAVLDGLGGSEAVRQRRVQAPR
jgi:DNA-binding MarR family transcriptional regulator